MSNPEMLILICLKKTLIALPEYLGLDTGTDTEELIT